MQTRFDIGQGVSWDDNDVMSYGVIVGHDQGMLQIVRVRGLSGYKRCYDETGSTWETDRDDVRLDGCPPPFSLLCMLSERGCYAHADLSACVKMSASDIARYDLFVLDGGDKVPDKTMSVVFDHPWRDEVEHEKLFVGRAHDDTAVHPQRSALMSRLIDAAERSAAENANGGFDGPDF